MQRPRATSPVLRSFLHKACLFWCLIPAAGCGHGGRQAPPRARPRLDGAAKGWNLLLLTIDTLRADRLGAYGYHQHANSPHLDRELGSGVIFEQAFSQRAATWPSLASILTGLYPSGHGVDENGYGFPDDLPTLPKVLHGAGYRTAAFLSNMCDANHQGWDAFGCFGGKDGKTVAHALEWAQAPGGERPFFLWVHLFGAHGPYFNGGDLADRELDPGYEGMLGPKKWRLDRVMKEKIQLSGADLRHLNALYDAAVIGSDRLAGDLLDGLREAGKLRHTLVAVTADHGEELYTHNGYLYHACSVYQTTLHVPLGMSAAGLLPAGARVQQPVELIDVLPTLLALLGVPSPTVQGRTLVPYLERPGAGGPGKPAFSEYGMSGIHTVVDDGWKLVDNPRDFDPVCIPGAPPHHFPIRRVELYDLGRDPSELFDQAGRAPARVARLQHLIAERFRGLARRSQPQKVPEKLRKELEDLGYVN